MIEITNKEHCSGCCACATVCPARCIKMMPDEEGFLYPVVDKERCTDCGLCEKRCPIINKYKSKEKEIISFASRAKNEKILLGSSSGGIFPLMAQWVLYQGGVVFGAAFSEDFSVEHIYIENEGELNRLQGSKYVQSKIGDAYIMAKVFLEEGRRVLFTGTPCQLGGLYAVLNKEYENLITLDIICHGVPSPMVWQSYVNTRESMAGASLEAVSFRHKKYGWQNYSLNMRFQNKEEYVSSHKEDLYFKAFLNDMSLRPSCHACEFKHKYRRSDITLADFWGIEKVCEGFEHGNGASLVLINSSKGKDLFQSISQETESESVDFDKAIAFNSAMIKSSPKNPNREEFLRIVREKGIMEARGFLKVGLLKKIKGKILAIINK